MLAVVAVATLAGCSAQPGNGELTFSQALWDHRTAHVGNSSQVTSLVHLVGPAPEGTYTLSLQTASTPYGLTINVPKPEKSCADLDSDRSAAVLLGLIANLDRVTVSCADQKRTITAADATKALGFDVKALGQDKTRLEAYVEHRD